MLADTSNNRNPKMKNDIFLLKKSKIPSILIECGFLSNPQEEKQLNDETYQNKIVYSIYHGIIDFFDKK
jgi:N-acetylmuramoyl-L-alanine amidase